MQYFGAFFLGLWCISHELAIHIWPYRARDSQNIPAAN